MTQYHRLSLCVSGGRRHVIHAAEVVDGLPVREDVLRAAYPCVRAHLGVKRVASLDGGQLRRLAGRRMIGVDISVGCVYTIREAFPRRAPEFPEEPSIWGVLLSCICPTFERSSPVISSMLRPVESCSLLTFKAFRSISAVKSSPLAAFGPVVFRCPFPPVVNSFSVTTSCRYSL